MTTRWERVAEALREQIRGGHGLVLRSDGLYLPSYSQLQETYEVSYGTIRTALLLLRAQGWIEGEQGVGVRVRPDHPR